MRRQQCKHIFKKKTSKYNKDDQCKCTSVLKYCYDHRRYNNNKDNNNIDDSNNNNNNINDSNNKQINNKIDFKLNDFSFDMRYLIDPYDTKHYLTEKQIILYNDINKNKKEQYLQLLDDLKPLKENNNYTDKFNKDKIIRDIIRLLEEYHDYSILPKSYCIKSIEFYQTMLNEIVNNDKSMLQQLIDNLDEYSINNKDLQVIDLNNIKYIPELKHKVMIMFKHVYDGAYCTRDGNLIIKQ